MEFLVLLSYKTERPYNSKSVTIPIFDESRWLRAEWLESRIAEWLDSWMAGCLDGSADS